MHSSYLMDNGFFEEIERTNFGDCDTYKDNIIGSLLEAQVPFMIDFAQEIVPKNCASLKSRWAEDIPNREKEYGKFNEEEEEKGDAMMVEAVYAKRKKESEIWQHYFYGVHVDVFNDHKILQYVFTKTELNLTQMRWFKLLKDYDMSTLYHRDFERKSLEFEVDDWVYFKISPMKDVMRFGKKGKLISWYIGPYVISKRIDNVAYDL
ncbi:uncharacterized protein [Solanum lycopersicum]|uniref:uncharacterized protein n=1 Tax=Solanum lycopersicum TaxID=4081 RepID=UPI003748B080